MKIKILIIILFAGMILHVQSKPAELGVVLGEPTGLSGRFWTGDNSIDVHLGLGHKGFGLHGSFLFHKISNLDIEGYKLPFYYGPRAQVGQHDKDSKIGVYFNFGSNYMFKEIPFNLFLEVAPGINLGDKTGFDICGGLGFRYVFGKHFRTDKKKEKPKGVEVTW